ncbi:sigma-70 family RNA polymerase sigma factor [Roseateles sp. BYS180W]|uniref:Sigma-70 family RNA polymerase sigma factor n=1 Tax=Roseateles rivi TaxID=3299028 RepID=A0ABW7FY57_9BURK
MSTPNPTDIQSQLHRLRPELLRYARLQLRNDAWAEDVVSETLLAALEAPQRFEGRSQLKSWLVGILKHKLVDQLRRQRREVALPSDEDDEALEQLLFTAQGRWINPPIDWGDQPEQALQQVDFLRVLEACVELLPAQQGRVFMMREWLDLDSAEICKELAMSSSNFFVCLHRARLRLRECLQQRWFDTPLEQPC